MTLNLTIRLAEFVQMLGIYRGTAQLSYWRPRQFCR